LSIDSNSPILPNPKPPTGTIDITDTANQLADTFATWATNITMTALAVTPYMGWTAWWGISTIIRAIVHGIMSYLSKTAEMLAFFLNTAIRKASQANDYMTAKTALNNLPPETSNADYEAAERLEMSAFHNLVVLGD